MIEFIKPEKRKVIPKAWGEEVILHNDEKYCGKLLRFKKGGRFSMHFHILKTETWYVNKGTFQLRHIDTETAETWIKNLFEGDIIEVDKGSPHQLIAITDGEIFECSTPHYDNDSYRVEKGDSQK